MQHFLANVRKGKRLNKQNAQVNEFKSMRNENYAYRIDSMLRWPQTQRGNSLYLVKVNAILPSCAGFLYVE